MSNALIQARIDGNVKSEASAVLATMGLTVSDAVRLLLTKVARDHALPRDLLEVGSGNPQQNPAFASFFGVLKDTPVFDGLEPLKVQKSLRDEWR